MHAIQLYCLLPKILCFSWSRSRACSERLDVAIDRPFIAAAFPGGRVGIIVVVDNISRRSARNAPFLSKRPPALARSRCARWRQD